MLRFSQTPNRINREETKGDDRVYTVGSPAMSIGIPEPLFRTYIPCKLNYQSVLPFKQLDRVLCCDETGTTKPLWQKATRKRKKSST
jgi:hypothetical protein